MRPQEIFCATDCTCCYEVPLTGHTATKTALVKRLVYSVNSIDHITFVARRCSLSNYRRV